MRAVDTNVLVRLVTGDDVTQTAAAERFVSAGAWVSHLVLAETIWVLASLYDREPPALAQTVEFLLKHRDLTIQNAEVVEAALAHFRSRPSLGLCVQLPIHLYGKKELLPSRKRNSTDVAWSRRPRR